MISNSIEINYAVVIFNCIFELKKITILLILSCYVFDKFLIINLFYEIEPNI